MHTSFPNASSIKSCTQHHLLHMHILQQNSLQGVLENWKKYLLIIESLSTLVVSHFSTWLCSILLFFCEFLFSSLLLILHFFEEWQVNWFCSFSFCCLLIASLLTHGTSFWITAGVEWNTSSRPLVQQLCQCWCNIISCSCKVACNNAAVNDNYRLLCSYRQWGCDAKLPSSMLAMSACKRPNTT